MDIILSRIKSSLVFHKWLSVFVIALGLGAIVVTVQHSNQRTLAAISTPLTIDVQVGKNQSTPVNQFLSPTFTTKSGNELIVVFLASDGDLGVSQNFASVSADTLSFSLAKRANTQKGTAEVWYAYSSEKLTNTQVIAKLQSGSYRGLIRVVTFTGAKNVLGTTVGGSAATGAPEVSLTTTANGSLVLGIGNDPIKATSRSVGPNQKITQQYQATKSNHTFWTQQYKAFTPNTGTLVKLNDAKPLTDAWNMVAVEVLALPLPPSTITPTPNLVAAYSLNESQGILASDASGHGLNGELRGGPIWTSGKYEGALAFDGDDYVELGNAMPLRITGSMTISGWIHAARFPQDDAAIVSKLSGDEKGYQLDTTVDRGPRTIGFKLANTAGSLMMRYGKTPLTVNNWYHVTGVYNASTKTLDVYLNGQLDNGVQIGTITALQKESPLSVNLARRASGGYGFIGKIDDIRIYDRALTPAEIQKDMLTALPSFPGVTLTPTSTPSLTPTITLTPTTPIVTNTPTPIPGGGVSVCPPFPAFPDEKCTGWRHLVGKTVPYADGSNKVFTGLKPQPCRGDSETTESIYIEKNDVVYEDCYFPKGLVIVGADVAITRSQIHGPVSTHWSNNYDYRNLTMTDVEIEQEGVADAGGAAAGGAHYSCKRCDIHHTGSGLHGGDYTLIQDSYIHDLNYTEGAHGAGIGMGQGHGSNSKLLHNNIQCNRLPGQPGTCSSALSIYAESKVVDGKTIYPHDILIQNNLFNTTGAYCVHATDSEGTNIKFIDNRFGKKFNSGCAAYGPVRSFYYPHDSVAGDSKRPACENPRSTSPQCAYGDEWSGNMWQDGSGEVKTGTEL